MVKNMIKNIEYKYGLEQDKDNRIKNMVKNMI